MHISSVFLISLVTSAATATGSLYVTKRLGLFKESVPIIVPSVKGLQEADARRVLLADDLLPMIGEPESAPDAKPGTVLRQSPPAGQALEADRPVTLTLAADPPSVPSVTGRTIAQASVALEQAGYVVQLAAPEPDDSIEAGKVKEQQPRGMEPLVKGGTVMLTPSAGVEQIEVPKLTGLGITQAKKQISDAGLKLGNLSWAYDDSLYPNVVLRQDPEPGAKIKPGGAIDLTVIRE